MNERIAPLTKSRVSLAPMAGITDYVLRSLVRRFSKTSLLTTEMISSEFLTNQFLSRRHKRMISECSGDEIYQQIQENEIILKRDENHSPISYQINGHKPELISASAEYLSQFADMIDINMGCPVNKVVKGQDGCALMRNPSLAADLVRAAKDGTDKPVSVKFRLGYTMDELNYVEFGQQMQDAGAGFITIHGRTRSQMYSGNANWGLIQKLKENVDVPVFANGDIVDIESAIDCLEQSKADGVAIGRGILGDPTLIHRIEHYLETGEKLSEPSLEEKITLLKLHIDEEIKLRGEEVGIKFVRKFYPYYISGIKNAAKIRGTLVTESDYGIIMKTIDSIYKLSC